jgi:hypothetical protein
MFWESTSEKYLSLIILQADRKIASPLDNLVQSNLGPKKIEK